MEQRGEAGWMKALVILVLCRIRVRYPAKPLLERQSTLSESEFD